MAIFVQSCHTGMDKKKIDIQGHRGARGLMPENTIPAFIKALDLGITTLELDLAVTADNQLVISHEPYMGSHITLDSAGNEITKKQELSYNLYQMTFDEIKTFDVGLKPFDRFPEQKKLKVHKPLLKELVDAVKEYSAKKEIKPIWYNIEIKSLPEGDNLYHPEPAEFSRLVYEFILANMDKKQLNVQSFDFRVLKYFHNNYPDIKLAVLIENELSIDQNLDSLGFIPEIYSCYFKLLNQKKVEYLQKKNMQVIPWTVNEKDDIATMVDWRVDGIISDYPNRVQRVLKNSK